MFWLNAAAKAAARASHAATRNVLARLPVVSAGQRMLAFEG